MRTRLVCFLVSALYGISSAGAQGGVESSPLPTPAAPTAAAVAARTGAQAEREADDMYARSNLAAAVALYEEAARLQTVPAETVRLLVLVAALEQRQAHDAQAIDAMTRAMVLAPDYAIALDNFAPKFSDIYYEGRKRALEQRARTAQDRIDSGEERLQAHDLAPARAAFREALAIDGTLAAALFGLAEVDREEGQAEAALAGYQKILALRRSNPASVRADTQVAALNNVGILYYDKGFFEDAEVALTEAVTLDPKRAQSWNNLGLARRKLGKKNEAIEALRKAYALEPDEAGANNLALAFIDGGSWIDAVALLLDATKRSPQSPQLWLNLGLAQQGMENLDGAIGSFQKVLVLDADDRQHFAATAAGYLAVAYTRQGKLELAAQQAQAQVSWSPEDVGGWINLGQAQLAAGKPADARQSLERALALDPARPEVSNNLGSAYYRLGDYTRAAAAFQRALAMRGDYLAASDNLGLTKRRLAEIELLERRLGMKIDTLGSGPKGILLSAVVPGSVADKADLLAGDSIMRIEGNAVTNAAELAAYLALQPLPRSLSCEILRAGKLVKARLKLG